MTQKPMLRVEVGALGAHQVRNMRGEGWTGAEVGVGTLVTALPLTDFFENNTRFFLIEFVGYISCVFVVMSSLVSLVSHVGCFQPSAGVFWL